MTHKIKTANDLKGILKVYFNDITSDEFRDIVRQTIGARCLAGKPKTLEIALEMIDAYVSSTNPDKLILESYGREYNLKDVWHKDSGLFTP